MCGAPHAIAYTDLVSSNTRPLPMTPLLAQTIAALVVFISLIVLVLMGYLFWLQRRGVAEQDREREARRQRLTALARTLPAVLQTPAPMTAESGALRGSRLRESALHPPHAGCGGGRMVAVVEVVTDRSRHDGQKHGNRQVSHRAILPVCRPPDRR